MRIRSFASLAVLLGTLVPALGACGGAASAGGGGAEDGTAGGEGGANEAPVLLRVRTTAGARYAHETRARTEIEGQVVLTDSMGHFEVASVDPATGNVAVTWHVGSIQLRDATGAPVSPGDGISTDLTGATFHRTVDPRGAIVGPVTVEGTTALNASFAETMRSMLEQAMVRFPEAAIRPGEAWADVVEMTVPIEGAMLAMRCELGYRFADLEGAGDERMAVLAVEGGCTSTPTTVASPSGPVTFEITSRSAGEQRVSVRDGLAGVMSMRTETLTHVTAGGRAVDMRMLQEVVTATRAM